MLLAFSRVTAFALPLLLLISQPLWANATPVIEPLDDVNTTVGSEVRFRVEPADADGDVPGVRLLGFPVGAMFSDNGDGTRTFSWLPGAEDIGQRTLIFEAFDATDDALFSQLSVSITVAEETDGGDNLPPQIESLIDQEVQIGGQFDFRVVPFDPEGQVPGLRLDAAPTGATLDDNGDGTRQFRWTPGRRDIGPNLVTFTVVDAADVLLQTQQTITLTVVDEDGNREHNEPPVFVELNDQQVFLGQTLALRVQPIDPDGGVPGMYVDRLPVGASFDDNFDGSRTFRWQPFPADLGELFLTFVIVDARDPTLRVRRTIRLDVARDPNNPVNFPPVIHSLRSSLLRVGDTLNQRVRPVDPDFTVPSLVALNAPPTSRFYDNGNGTRTLRWQVGADDIGSTKLTFRATDADDASVTVDGSVDVEVVEASSLDRPGERLRSLAARRDFLIGFAATLEAKLLPDNQLYRDIAAQEFNIVTGENSHKMNWIQPRRGVYNWADADDLADYAMANDLVLHGHPLVWHAQLPGWVKALTPADAQAVMRDHIRQLAGRYQGRAGVWDVVNEALEDDGSLRQSIWFKGMGEAYIRDAFVTARQSDPAAVLLYNEYDVAWANAKSDAMYELIEKELNTGTPIDGVGFQMHLWADFDAFEEVAANFQRFADLGVDIYITEFDVSLMPEHDPARQAEIYQRILDICLAQPRCRAMQSWGYTDRYSWRAHYQPLMFDGRYRAKPAYFALQNSLAATLP